MIFDERDIVEEKDDKKDFSPHEEQMSFADINSETKEKIVEAPSQQKEVEENNFENEDDDALVGEEDKEIILDEEGNINRGLKQVIHEAMIPYSEYVILDRALPRVEDGLKPVQRRILYSMYELGLTPEKPFKKSAKVVGDCMANYHPHGDSSVYNAMVRMSQKFNMRDVLVNGHGNFGSMDGDSAAAMRYTEAKLSPIAMELLKDINKDTVRWVSNYDDSKKEPDMLPGRFPNLLVNGSSGIAVGLATNIPPHNLGETIDAVVAYIDKKRITLEEIMQHVKGPDFPMGGIILGTDGIKDAYATGKGKVVVRAKTHIEGTESTKKAIVVDEFPYQVNKANLLNKIARLREDNKDILGGISEIRDESDRNGVRAVIYCKKDANVEMIQNYLFKHTDLQTSFGVNMVAIANGKPRQMGLLEIISYYAEYQREVVLRRTKYDLTAAKQKEHIISGLLIAIKNIDEVIKIIKASKSTVEAKITLRKRFDLTEKQAQAVLDMRLARLTNLEVEKLEAQLKELLLQIEKLSAIVASKQRQFTIVKKEMLAVKKAYNTKRRTEIMSDTSGLTDVKEFNFKPVKDIIIGINERGAIKQISPKSFSMTARVVGDNSNLNEVHNILVATETDKELMLFTNLGNVHRITQDNILEARWKDRGSKLAELIKKFDPEEKVIALFPLNGKLPKADLVVFTKNGIIKRSSFSEYDVKKQTYEAMKLKEEDEVINVEIFDKKATMMFVTKEGMVLNASIDDIPTQKRLSGGVKGIKLNDSDNVMFAGFVNEKDKIALVTTKGYSKKVNAKDIDPMARYRKGVKIISLGMDNGFDLVYANRVDNTHEVYIVNDKKKITSLNTDYMPVENRTTKGKLVTKNKKAIKIKVLHKYLWEPKEFLYTKK